MPELIEAEYYAGALRAALDVGITGVSTLDELVGGGPESSRSVVSALRDVSLTDVQRHGKVLLAATSGGHRLWIRFGMTGRLVVGDLDPVPLLEYGPQRDDRQWDRFIIELADGRSVRLNDSRRFARVGVGDLPARLGPDAASIDAAALGKALAGRRAVKAVLLDQERIAGLGNLLVDETLWRVGVDPSRPADSLDADDVAGLAAGIVEVIDDLTVRGGSHRGDLQSQRGGGTCPRDGVELIHAVVAGRTTWSCPAHQR